MSKVKNSQQSTKNFEAFYSTNAYTRTYDSCWNHNLILNELKVMNIAGSHTISQLKSSKLTNEQAEAVNENSILNGINDDTFERALLLKYSIFYCQSSLIKYK